VRTLAQATSRKLVRGFEPGSKASARRRASEKLANLVQKANQVRIDLLAHLLRVYSRTLAQASMR
jgi:hypothetical protein